MKTVQSRRRKETRLRLRSWLKRQIESSKFDGLQWIDREKQIFRVPWKHGSKQNWSLDRDACLFRGWATYTGKYKEGKDKPDPKRWKTNFRCALNALPDIEHLPKEDSTQGQDAYRVYIMTPKDKLDRKKKQRKASKPVQSSIDVSLLTPPPSSESETELSDQEVPSEDEIIQIVDDIATGLDENGMQLFSSSSTTSEDLLPLGILQQINQYPQTLPVDWFLHFETDKVRVEKSVI